MSNSYAFAFPKPHSTSFKLLSSSTVGYIDDSIFYRLDLNTGKAEALQYLVNYTVIQKAEHIKPLHLFIKEESQS